MFHSLCASARAFIESAVYPAEFSYETRPIIEGDPELARVEEQLEWANRTVLVPTLLITPPKPITQLELVLAELEMLKIKNANLEEEKVTLKAQFAERQARLDSEREQKSKRIALEHAAAIAAVTNNFAIENLRLRAELDSSNRRCRTANRVGKSNCDKRVEMWAEKIKLAKDLESANARIATMQSAFDRQMDASVERLVELDDRRKLAEAEAEVMSRQRDLCIERFLKLEQQSQEAEAEAAETSRQEVLALAVAQTANAQLSRQCQMLQDASKRSVDEMANLKSRLKKMQKAEAVSASIANIMTDHASRMEMSLEWYDERRDAALQELRKVRHQLDRANASIFALHHSLRPYDVDAGRSMPFEMMLMPSAVLRSLEAPW